MNQNTAQVYVSNGKVDAVLINGSVSEFTATYRDTTPADCKVCGEKLPLEGALTICEHCLELQQAAAESDIKRYPDDDEDADKCEQCGREMTDEGWTQYCPTCEDEREQEEADATHDRIKDDKAEREYELSQESEEGEKTQEEREGLNQDFEACGKLV